MTNQKLKSIFHEYYTYLHNLNTGIQTKQLVEEDTKIFQDEIPPAMTRGHLLFMCSEAQKFVDEGRIEKAMRWLGFLQGVLWSDNEFSLDELKNHSRPDEETK
jgi:hypothetical protein